MKSLFLFFAVSVYLLFFSCSPLHEDDSGNISFSIEEPCRDTCNIIYYPNDLENSVLDCGFKDFTYNDDYIFLCFPPGYDIIEFIGWAPLNQEQYYTKFWRFSISDNCIIFEPFRNLIEDIFTYGFKLDVIICNNSDNADFTD